MRIFKTKVFNRFAQKERIEDEALSLAVNSAEKGQVDAVLKGGLIKQRVARPGEGKRGGFRTIIAYRSGDRAFFLYGFAKSQQSNIAAKDLDRLIELGAIFIDLSDDDLTMAMDEGELFEVPYGEDEEEVSE